MKKIVLAGLLVASSAVMANDYSPFIGGGLITAEVEADSGVASGHEAGFNVRAGFAADNHRVYLSYDGIDTDPDATHLAAVNLEGVTSPHRFSNWLATRVFAGAHIGVSGVDNHYDAMYGVQAGVLFDLTANLSLEAGGKYALSEVSGVDNIQTFYGAVNIQF